MLSPETIQMVKSTAPILQEHGETLTKHFYKRMFTHNPEVAPYFNRGNQSEGTQQRALAAAICAYAENIDNLEVLGEAVELIAQKHASLMIKPEHYPIVGSNLLESIKEVLGDGATQEIIDAWAQAYSFLADILIGRENQIYTDNAQKTHGWTGFKKFKVIKKEPESNVITSFYLKPDDSESLPIFLPGQYITVRVSTSDGSTTMRNYSLSDRPGMDYFRISVKKEISDNHCDPKGYVSNKLHDEINVGDTLEIGPPCGEFTLNIKDKHDRPLVLMAAGVGITPIISILNSALESMPNRKIFLIHGCLNEEVQAFKATIDDLADKYNNLQIHYRYSDINPENEVLNEKYCSQGFVDADLIESLVPNRHADYYFCGPKPFMMNIYQDLLRWGIPASQVHFEFFGPKQELSGNV